jgi:hypothetical protein
MSGDLKNIGEVSKFSTSAQNLVRLPNWFLGVKFSRTWSIGVHCKVQSKKFTVHRILKVSYPIPRDYLHTEIGPFFYKMNS